MDTQSKPTCFFIDEFHRLDADGTDPSRNYSNLLATDGRKHLLTGCIASQSLQLSNDWLQNTCTKYLGSFDAPESKMLAATWLGFGRNIDALDSLPPNYFFLKHGSNCFVVNVGFQSFNTIADKKYIESFNEDVLRRRPELKKLFEKPEKVKPEVFVPNDAVHQLAKLVLENPGYSIGEYTTMSGWGTQKFTKAKEGNIYIEQVRISTGGKTTFQTLKVKEIFWKRFGLKAPVYDRGSGFLHFCVTKNLERKFESKCFVGREVKIGNRYVDLLLDEKIAIQVCCFNKVDDEVLAALEIASQIESVWCVFIDKKKKAIFEKRLPEKTNIEVKLLCDVLSRKKRS